MNAIAETTSLLSPSLERPVWMERQWVAIDGMGTVRNSMATSATLLGSASRTGSVFAQAIPGLQIAGGLLISYNAARHNIPNAWREFRAVDANDREGKWISGLGLSSQLLYGSFGPALTVSGAAAAASLATSGAVSSALLQASEIAAYGALGGLCVVRGCVMAARSTINLCRLIPFHERFLEEVQGGNALQFLKDEMEDEAVFRRNVGDAAADMVRVYTDGPVEDLLRAVDKGIFKQKCKQWLTLSIAIFMIAGGIASLILSGGLSGIAIAAIIGLSFTLMEAEWLIFDKSDWFNTLVDKLYTPLELPTPKMAEPASLGDEPVDLRLPGLSPLGEGTVSSHN